MCCGCPGFDKVYAVDVQDLTRCMLWLLWMSGFDKVYAVVLWMSRI